VTVPFLLGEGTPEELIVTGSVTVGTVVGAELKTVSVSVSVIFTEEPGTSELDVDIVDDAGVTMELAALAATAGPTSSCSPESGSVARPQVSPTLLKLRP
jgi:hypothetical protein